MPIINRPRHVVAVAAAAAVAMLALLAVPAPPAYADNCQPEELVYRAATGDTAWESPVATDDDDPRCYVANGLGCPNQAAQPDCVVGIAGFAASGKPYPGCYDAGPIVTLRWMVENTLCAATGGDPGSSGG